MSDRKLSAFDRNFDFNDDGHLSAVENGVRTAAIMQTIEHSTNCEEEYDFEDNATDSLGEAADDLDSLYDEWAKNIVGPEDIDRNDLIKP